MTLKEVGFAASTIWVILAAILVIFMQAGFAFLEAGLTRMKNVGHIAAKNVLILAIADVNAGEKAGSLKNGPARPFLTFVSSQNIGWTKAQIL